MKVMKVLKYNGVKNGEPTFAQDGCIVNGFRRYCTSCWQKKQNGFCIMEFEAKQEGAIVETVRTYQ